ncbi:MAG: protein kinase [Anaerolineales bacterium]|nr:protein kinase [Anaerolineales bacterium]
MVELVGQTLANYTLLSKIGSGGMASVFEAQDQIHEEIVALKILAPQLAIEPTFRERFKREAQVLSRLEHPNIMPILDYGESNGLFYIVMPFMEVGCLDDRLESGPLDVQEGARIFKQIAAALQFAHDSGVVHRDVKPSNILLDKFGNAWLSDFGFAHVSDASVSLTGSAIIGTPAYIAPEVVLGDPVTPASDQYSLGVVLYRMSTGRLPYDAETPMAIAVKQASEPLPRPRWVNPNLPDAVEEIIYRVLSKDPEDRYPSIAALHAAFQNALHEAIDPDSGVIKPGARGQLVGTELYDSPELDSAGVEEAEVPEEKKRKRRVLALVLLSLLVLPLACWAGARLGSGFVSLTPQVTEVAAVGSLNDLDATLTALSTELAPQRGTAMATGEVETKVAQTVTSMAMAGEGLVLVSVTPTVTLEGETLLSGTSTDVGFSTATSTGHPPLATELQPSPTEAADATPVTTPTLTHTLPPGVTPSATQIPPNTYTPTLTHTLTLTTTMQVTTPTVSATVSNTPPFTSSPTSTRTPAPSPSMTSTTPPSGDVCSTATLNNFSVSGLYVNWTLTNNGTETINITETYINWPSSNEELIKVYLGGSKIWDETDESPPTTLGSDWEGGSRAIAPSMSKTLKFEFDVNAASSGYSLTLTLNNTCQINAGG